MKLECDVVQDLYPLFHEGELSPRVKKEVEEHLKECNACRNIYESGEGFIDTISNERVPSELAPSKKVDDKLKTKLKIRRLKSAILLLIGIFLLVFYIQFHDNRIAMQVDLTDEEQIVTNLMVNVESVPKGYFNAEEFNKGILLLPEINKRLVGHLTPIENYPLKKDGYGALWMDLWPVENYATFLNERAKQGKWSAKDQEAYNKLVDLLKQYGTSMDKELQKVRGNSETLVFRSLFQPIDTKSFLTLTKKIDDLAYIYPTFNKFPEEMKAYPENQLRDELKKIFNLKDEKLTISTYGAPVSKYTFKIEGKDSKGGIYYDGEVDYYTGEIIKFLSIGFGSKGERISEAKAWEQVNQFLANLNNKGLRWKAEYIGLNYHYSGDVDLYSFRISPINKITGSKDTRILYINSQDGKMQMYDRISISD